MGFFASLLLAARAAPCCVQREISGLIIERHVSGQDFAINKV
jgi:hypothetical protein